MAMVSAGYRSHTTPAVMKKSTKLCRKRRVQAQNRSNLRRKPSGAAIRRFSDPDGFLWLVAWNPAFRISED
jgi:hypothetical protein